MLDFCLALEGGGFCSFSFRIHDAYRLMASGVCAAFSGLMFIKSFFDIFCNAGIQATALAEEDIDKVHWGYYIAKRYQPHTRDSIYEKIGA